jgi:Zn-dependent peptidase ImmA (M78 family)
MSEATKTPYVPAKESPEEIETRALDILHSHGITSAPVDPVTLANRQGIKVHNAKFSEDGLSGMVAKRGEDVTILVNQGDPPYRKRFTIAHELGHVFLHLRSDGEFIDSQVDLFRDTCPPTENSPDKIVEVQANQFAAALLMPRNFVREQFRRTTSVSDLARVFNVSEEAMGIRLARLGLA